MKLWIFLLGIWDICSNINPHDFEERALFLSRKYPKCLKAYGLGLNAHKARKKSLREKYI